MGNWWSGNPQQPKVQYEVVLPTGARAFELLYTGDVDTWDAVAARYGMDKFAYSCGLSNCDREAVCLRYVKAAVQSDKRHVTIERFKAPTLHIPTSQDMKGLLSEGFRLNEVAAAVRGPLVLLVLHEARDYVSQVAFPLLQLNTNLDDTADKRKTERPKLLRHLSKDSKSESKKRPCSGGGEGRQGEGKGEGVERNSRQDRAGGRCLGVLQAPSKDMTIISCNISPDLSQTAVMFYSLSALTRTFCYTLHFYSNLSLQQEGAVSSSSSSSSQPASASSCSLAPAPSQDQAASQESPSQAASQETESQSSEPHAPHLLQMVKLSREVQPYFVYDPRYCWSRIAVANYECRDMGIAHELVVLNLQGTGEGGEGAQVVRRGKLSLPALFGNSRFNLLYSKDGELIILQKLTDDRFGVTSFCDIYIFNADDLTLIKYVTASLPGLFHICKVSYEPVFSRCGSYMRILDHHMSISSSDGRGDSDEYTVVQIYQLPRSLDLMSQCRRVILQQLAHERLVHCLPVPHKLQDYLGFGPIY